MEDTNVPTDLVEAAYDSLISCCHQVLPSKVQALSELRLTRQQGETLWYVHRNSGVRLSDVAIRLQVGRSAATQLVDGLVVRDLLKRLPSELDHRVVELALTAEGEALLAHFRTRQLEHLRHVLARLTPTELRLLAHLGSKLTP